MIIKPSQELAENQPITVPALGYDGEPTQLEEPFLCDKLCKLVKS